MTPDQKADKIIQGLAATGVATGAVPVPTTVPFMAAVAGGVVAIGACYGVSVSKDEAWKLIREFFKAAGLVWASCFVGGQFITWILAATGFGLPAALAMDAGMSAAIAYAVGNAAKHYFRGQHARGDLSAIMRGEIRTIMREGLAKAKTKPRAGNA